MSEHQLFACRDPTPIEGVAIICGADERNLARTRPVPSSDGIGRKADQARDLELALPVSLPSDGRMGYHRTVCEQTKGTDMTGSGIQVDQSPSRLRRARSTAHRTIDRVKAPLQPLGMHPLPQPAAIRGLARFIRDWRAYNRLVHPGSPFAIRPHDWMPILTEWTEQAGIPDPFYFHQDLWAARRIYRRAPALHVDVGSRIDGFIAHLLTFMPVTVVDIRQLESTVSGLDFIRSDATGLSEFVDDSVESLSSLHAVEHFGLGRYGDPVDPRAPFKAMESLARVLAPAGFLYFSVPVGRERLLFNAHRIFAPGTIVSALDGLELLSFSAVSDDGVLLEDIEPAAASTFDTHSPPHCPVVPEFPGAG